MQYWRTMAVMAACRDLTSEMLDAVHRDFCSKVKHIRWCTLSVVCKMQLTASLVAECITGCMLHHRYSSHVDQLQKAHAVMQVTLMS